MVWDECIGEGNVLWVPNFGFVSVQGRVFGRLALKSGGVLLAKHVLV